MKSIASAIVILASSACAFVPTSNVPLSSPSSLRLSDEVLEVLEEIPNDPANLNELIRKSQSKAIPFMERPELLDGSMAGDVGFDPLGLAKSPKILRIFREAEVKHARLAMLAAAGWPLSELLDQKIAGLFNLAPALDAAGRATPSALSHISDEYWIGVVAFAAMVDLYGSKVALENDEAYFPGNLGFDPLGFYPDDSDPKGQKAMQLAEIKHGRTAMMVFAFYLMEESVSQGSLFNPLALGGN